VGKRNAKWGESGVAGMHREKNCAWGWPLLGNAREFKKGGGDDTQTNERGRGRGFKNSSAIEAERVGPVKKPKRNATDCKACNESERPNQLSSQLGGVLAVRT